jgi:hypothetical protein
MEIGRRASACRVQGRGLPNDLHSFFLTALEPDLDKCLAPTVPLQQLLPQRYRQ